MNFTAIFIILFAIETFAKLPNEKFAVPKEDPDYSFFQEIEDIFTRENFDFSPLPKQLELHWPLRDNHFTIFDAFETSEVGEYVDENGQKGYWTMAHQAIDVIRSSISISTEVIAPVSGFAVVSCDRFDGAKCEDIVEPYRHAVSIYDPRSHLIVGLLHVGPIPELKNAKGPIWVNQGQLIGHLGEVSPAKPEYVDAFRHTHLFLMDISLKNPKLLNPIDHFPDYTDAVKPIVQEMYLRNDQGEKVKILSDGKFDLVVSTFDLDGRSSIQMPISSLSYKVYDDQHRVLADVKNCQIDEILNSSNDRETITSMKSLFDLEETLRDISPDYWQDASVNVGVKNRSFRYSLTNLQRSGWNQCRLVLDEEGFLEITNSVQWIEVQVVATDHRGNKRTSNTKFFRSR